MNVKETVILFVGIMVSLFKCSDFKDEKIILKKGLLLSLFMWYILIAVFYKIVSNTETKQS